jgi:hypothetical protein
MIREMIPQRGSPMHTVTHHDLSAYPVKLRRTRSVGRRPELLDLARSRTDQTEATEVAIAAAALNRMLEFGRPNYVRID